MAGSGHKELLSPYDFLFFIAHVREDLPDTESTFFTRDLYDKYSLAPNIKELWALAQSPTVNDAEVKGNSCVNQEESSVWESCESDAPSVESKVKQKDVNSEPSILYPDPRLPYPCESSLSSKDQKTYLGTLMSKKPREPPQALKAQVLNEVSQFMNYLREVARICADDYNHIPQGALQYSEDFLRNCIECMRIFPQLYQITEMTSLTGGTFNPGLSFTFEKQLLMMGSVDVTDHKIVPTDVQLATDYQSVSSETPPAKKAKDKYAQTISSDCNAEKLCAHYEPHVCLTQDALLRLLDNHGPEFSEPWELPVWVKLDQGKGSSKRKTVYIDSPLLKTEVTTRERSHIFHEESLKLSINKTGEKKAFHLMTEIPAADKPLPPESSQRSLVSFEEPSLDFEMDLVDLETFGEATVKPSKKRKSQLDTAVTGEPAESTPLPRCMTTRSRANLQSKTTSGSKEEVATSLTGKDDCVKETSEPGSSPTVPKARLLTQDPTHECEEDPSLAGDSEDERLVIDDSMEGAPTPTKSPGDPVTPSKTPSPPPPKKALGKRRVSRRAIVAGDQLGHILHMQTAMLKPRKETVKTPIVCLDPILTPHATGPPVQPHATSLVKPCVSSYLESGQHQDGEACAATRNASASSLNTEHKKLLSQELQGSAEAEQDYEAPERGNLLYKLYSLQDLLLLVRSSVLLTHTRRVGSGSNQHVPVHVLPKLEYQLCYGVECLSRSEACQLWMETLLHSSTVSHIAHIDAHTSKVAMLRNLPEDWKQKLSCDFKPSKSLNILHHLLKKLTGLEEGRYLIVHKAGEPFVTILKEADGKVARGAYNLQQIHSTVPQPPSPGAVPWLPVDPAVVLPFHKKHGRVPCTFAPRDLQKTVKGAPTQSNDGKAKNPRAPQSNAKAGGKKKNKGKRAARRKKWMKKQIQRSTENPNT